jgi:hypothetical protein
MTEAATKAATKAAADAAAEADVDAPIESQHRFYFRWVPAVLFRPVRAFARIAAQTKGVWLTPILILTLTAVVYVIASGPTRKAIAAAAPAELPENFQYFSPEQQAQFQQSSAATQGNVFIYAFPALVAVLKVWFGWLLVGGLLHLVMTLLGGRGDTGAAMNLVAWAGLPYAVLDIVRTVFVLSTHQVVKTSGLAGFAPSGESAWAQFAAYLLALVDIYVIWHIILLVVGVRASNGISRGKAAGGVIFTILLVLSVQALISFGISRLGSLTVIRPFF